MSHFRLNITAISLVAMFGVCLLPKMVEAQYEIPFSVVGSGGAALAGTTYNIAGTLGQIAPGLSGNSADSVDAGFWYLQNYNVTGVKSPTGGVAKTYELYQNYPNPFNPSTVINYQLPTNGQVNLKVYDILGREVATLVNERENAGSYSVKFNGSRLASGVYFYRLTAGNFVSVKKLVVLK